MSKYQMNKHVNHNGKVYPKDSEIQKDDGAFEVLNQAGHVNEVANEVFAAAEEVVESSSESKDEPVEQAQPASKRRR